MPNELKPCPFCGKSVAKVATIAGIEMMDTDNINYAWSIRHYSVVCNYLSGGCGAMVGTSHETEAEAIEAWNRRADNG